jgi:hypothetical protein
MTVYSQKCDVGLCLKEVKKKGKVVPVLNYLSTMTCRYTAEWSALKIIIKK